MRVESPETIQSRTACQPIESPCCSATERKASLDHPKCSFCFERNTQNYISEEKLGRRLPIESESQFQNGSGYG